MLSNSRDPFRKKSCLLDSSSVSSNSVYVVVPKRALKAKSCRDPTTYHAVRIGGALTILRHQIPSRNHLYHQLPLRHHGHLALTVLPLLLLLSQNATKNSPEKTRFSRESLRTKLQRERSHAEKQSRVHPPSSSDLNCGDATVSSSPCTELIRSQGSTQTRERERRALERQDSRNYRPARWSRPSRAREMNESSVETTDLPDGVAGG